MTAPKTQGFSLIPHPETPVSWEGDIHVDITGPSHAELGLSYRLSADTRYIRVPRQQVIERADGLWRHTCFEAFIATGTGSAYREFNFSPSRQWQAYDFSDYRQDGRPAPTELPVIDCRRSADALELNVLLPLMNMPPGEQLRLGLSAVVESSDGGLSYWALQHPPGRPDFHHADTFALEFIFTAST